MSNVLNTLAEREKRYGVFMDNACTAQMLKLELRRSKMWSQLEVDQQEALELIMSKIGRMLSGDVNYIDSWHDIAGYATLIEKRLDGENLGQMQAQADAQCESAYQTFALTGEPSALDPRPKVPLSSPFMSDWDQYLKDLRAWLKRNPGMDT